MRSGTMSVYRLETACDDKGGWRSFILDSSAGDKVVWGSLRFTHERSAINSGEQVLRQMRERE